MAKMFFFKQINWKTKTDNDQDATYFQKEIKNIQETS